MPASVTEEHISTRRIPGSPRIEVDLVPSTLEANPDAATDDALALYRAIFAKSTEAIAILDPQGHYIEQNTAHNHLLGYSDAELHGQTPAIHLGQEEFENIVAELRRTGTCKRECISRTKGGVELVIELSSFSVRNQLGEPVCYVGIKRNITEQKHATLELRQKFNELQAIYRMAEAVSRAAALDDIYALALYELINTVHADRASVLLIDPDGVMRFKAWRGLSDEYRKAVEGHTPWSPNDPDPKPVLVPDVFADANLKNLYPVLSHEGIRAVGFIPLLDSGRLLGKFMIYYNTPHVVLPAQLRLAQTIARHIAFAIARKKNETSLQEANLAKSQFLATMSHELRTPLNAIGGYAELLEMGLHGPVTDEQRQDIARIQRSQKHLLGLINDLLSFARIETGHVELRDEEVSIEDTLVGVEVLIAPQIRQKGLKYLREQSATGISCRGDRDKVSQVLLNLVSNAVKFTPESGLVTVDWKTKPDKVSIRISDTGPGIPPQKLDAIFEPFVQLRGSPSRITEGTGLGLAISRELARAMGGDVTVSSVVGKGSVFTLTLPRV